MRVFTNLTPFIPLSFKGGEEEIYREGFHPSLTYTPPSLAKGRGQGDRLLINLYNLPESLQRQVERSK